MKTVVLSHPAAKDLDGLQPKIRDTISEALNVFAITGQGDVKKLFGQESMLRLRIGRHRAIFTQSATTIDVLYIGKRETTTYR